MFKLAVILCFAAGFVFSTLAQGNESQTPKQQPQTQMDKFQKHGNDSTKVRGESRADRGESNAFNSVCPVDGQKVDPSVKPIRYKGKEYGFDSPSCELVFSENPELYAGNLTRNGEKYTRHDLEPENRKGIENQNMQDNDNQGNNNKDNQQ